MAGKRCMKRRHKAHKIHKNRRRIRRNQKGGFIPLPLMALGAGLLTPIIADGVNDIVKRLGIKF